MKLWEAGERVGSSYNSMKDQKTNAAIKLAPKVKAKKSKPKKIIKGSSSSGGGGNNGKSSLSSSLGRGGSSLGRGGNGNNHWGRVTDVYGDSDYNGGVLDKNDPNYDSTEEESGGFFLQGFGSNQTHGYDNRVDSSPPRNGYNVIRQPTPPIIPQLSLPEYKLLVRKFLEEYFVSGDRLEVERCMRDTWLPDFHFEMVKRTITMAMDRNARGCEAASLLLSFLHGRSILTTDEVGKGIERLFEVIDDLKVDVPNASRLLSQFVARAVVDEILPPVFLTDPTVIKLGGQAIQEAVTLLSVKHGQARVEKVWGPGAAEFADDLKRVIKLIIAEYLDTRDVEEAALSVRLLEAPRYGHELVKRALVMGVDCNEDAQVHLSELFNHLVSTGLVTQDPLIIGFQRYCFFVNIFGFSIILSRF
jgi:programmed cell death protein 4